MTAYVIRRLALIPVVVLMLSMFVFGLVRMVPGDAVSAKLQNSYNLEQKEALLAHYGLDEPIPKQYVIWLGEVVRGDFGTSFIDNTSIGADIKERLPVTLEFLVLVMLMQVPLGVGLGVLSAVYQDSALDYAIRFLSILLLAIPSFWLATLVIILPSVWWTWSLPIGYSKLWDDPLRNLYQLSVPAAVAAISSAAVLMRVTRSQMLEVTRSDYVRTARAKGLSPRVVVLRHTLKNALVPVITVVGLTVGVGVGGSVIIEQIFSIPGIGAFTASSLITRDYPAIQAVTLLVGVTLCVVNLIVDLTYGLVDPRIRFR